MIRRYKAVDNPDFVELAPLSAADHLCGDDVMGQVQLISAETEQDYAAIRDIFRDV